MAGSLNSVPRLLPQTPEEGRIFAEAAYRAGHEGVMAKELGSSYTPVMRGKAWFKLKHVLSLDLVIIAADWGYGRRHGWLSNFHLAASEAETGRYLPVGKTFKGLTDSEFAEMTRRLLILENSHQGGTVFVQPQLVVEVLFNEIQASPNSWWDWPCVLPGFIAGRSVFRPAMLTSSKLFYTLFMRSSSSLKDGQEKLLGYEAFPVWL